MPETNDSRPEGGDPASRTIPLQVGDSVSFGKTVGESDIYLFAGITGEVSPNPLTQ